MTTFGRRCYSIRKHRESYNRVKVACCFVCVGQRGETPEIYKVDRGYPRNLKLKVRLILPPLIDIDILYLTTVLCLALKAC